MQRKELQNSMAEISISEDKMQIDFNEWCSRQPQIIEHFHVANERYTNKRQGALLKRKGVKAGVCDHWIILQNKIIAVELKTDKGVLSEKQKEFISKLQKANIPVKVAYSIFEATQWVKEQIEKGV